LAWTVEYDRRVLKDLKRLDRQAQQTILNFFDDRMAPAADPRVFGKPLTAAFTGLWRYRIGDYRAICRIEAHRLVVLVVRVGHRSTVYDD
jgi:mRNA interferase RelE/StbE